MSAKLATQQRKKLAEAFASLERSICVDMFEMGYLLRKRYPLKMTAAEESVRAYAVHLLTKANCSPRIVPVGDARLLFYKRAPRSAGRSS
jgi:hypothetical protein